MKVVLRADVEGLGRKGEVCDVAAGYARNYLVPKGLALKSSPGAELQAEAMRRSAALRRAADRADAEEIAVKLAPSVLSVSARAAESGHLYGSVGPAEIVAAVADQVGAVVDSQGRGPRCADQGDRAPTPCCSGSTSMSKYRSRWRWRLED